MPELIDVIQNRLTSRQRRKPGMSVTHSARSPVGGRGLGHWHALQSQKSELVRAPLNDTKQLYLSARRLSRAAHEARCLHRKVLIQATYSPPQAPDLDRVVYFFGHGGRQSVMRFWVKLKRSASSQTLQAVLKAFDDIQEARSPEPKNKFSACSASLPPIENFISRAQRLDVQGHGDAALDLIYDSVDGILQKAEFHELDQILADIQPADYSMDILLGILTATLPAKTRLRSRAVLWREIETTLKKRGEYEPGLLAGLEG